MALIAIVLLAGPGGGMAVQGALAAPPPAPTPTNCQLGLGGNIQHVIDIQFDNLHFTRDNPNVPSDLEQMPNLLHFLESNGTLVTNEHTPLIAHTATDILTTLTGVYGDRMGVPVSNSFRYFNPNGTSNPGVSFAYWTDPIYDYSTATPTDTTYNMLTASGLNAPAPWVPFTRAGCNVGEVAVANTVLENTATDIPTVFGANSPQQQEVASDPHQAAADFVGIAVHCTSGAAFCTTANGVQADKLPDEPGGYSGYQALFGAKYVDPQISPSGPLADLNGNVIQSPTGNVGFPGFDGMSAAVSLSYVASMQEHGVPVTYAYISDAHDVHPNGPAYGPGQAGYVAALKAYDDAFGTFFTRLAQDGINASNTLFVVSADEGDHFVGGAPTPANCDGVTVACSYSQIGEVNANLAGLLATEQGVTTPFKVHSDSAPTFYLNGNPAQNDTVTRAFERATGALTATDPITGQNVQVAKYLADQTEMVLLHMVTADPARTPTFTMFANPDFYLYAGAANCNSACVQVEAAYAWNHGMVSPDVNTTWLGLVGPGVLRLGADDAVWSDHTDVRPTMMALLNLKDDYSHDGRVLVEVLDPSALPVSLRQHRGTFLDLAQAYKQLNAPLGQFGLTSLRVSTVEMRSDTPGDAQYQALDGALASLGAQRDALAGQMAAALEGSAFNNQPLNEVQARVMIAQARTLEFSMGALADVAGH
ncbi:MAG TPA: hypothetical protein VFN57_07405 [Thermomicrobiaceae bacterium]|nr:hypothetical protein [Thermomicrobiaceae bacterium]